MQPNYGNFNCISHQHISHQPSTTAMSSLLHAACRIEAAVNAYRSVKEHADRELWKVKFETEKVCKSFKRFTAMDPHGSQSIFN
jgi:hypothetical protein